MSELFQFFYLVAAEHDIHLFEILLIRPAEAREPAILNALSALIAASWLEGHIQIGVAASNDPL